jgi:PncC family amidohydrolase
MATQDELDQAARRVAALLTERRARVVFAESCTAGLVAQSLSRVPGVSAVLCGSMVVYRNETKAAWLGVGPDILDDPGPVSEEVAAAMTEGALRMTPEADIALSITGHLGPDAPPDQDGLVFVGLQHRSFTDRDRTEPPAIERHELDPAPEATTKDQWRDLRARRQRIIAARALTTLHDFVTAHWPR